MIKSIATGVLVFAFAVLAQAATAQDAEVFDPGDSQPPSKVSPGQSSDGTRTPKARPSISGDVVSGLWVYEATCKDRSFSGTFEFAATGNEFVGRTLGASNSVGATVSKGRVNGRNVSFLNTYSFLGTVVETWSGTLSGDKKSIEGAFTGPRTNNCHFRLRR